ncbi:MAG TPA: GDP-mannose 4,6-dehydratase [Steroidobacteraceae bacterium]|nr:GDP-mannose 4,6-dehydratase [Steroidobacteraceae bacterium]
MKKNFLVIGSNSFSGAYFVKYLVENRHGVLGVSRSPEPADVMLPYKWLPGSDKFSFRQIDLNHQLEELMALVKEFQPEYIVNFAAQGMVAQSWDSPQDWYQTNVVAQVRLHDQLRKLSFLRKYVHVSTPEVYGSTDGWIKERFNFAPSTPYAVSRAACDLHLMSFFKAYQFPVCFTRAANVYGPGQQLYRIIPRAMLCARIGKKMLLHGGGHSVRSFIHMSDVADATYRIAMKGVPGESYHISTPDTTSIRALVEKVCEMTGIPFQDLALVSEDRLGKDQAYLLDSAKIRSDLNWSHQVTLDMGLQETLAWVDTHLDALKELPADYVHKP